MYVIAETVTPIVDPAELANPPSDVVEYFGWVQAPPTAGDPESTIYLDSRGRDDPTLSQSWPPGYVHPAIVVQKGSNPGERSRVSQRKRVSRRKTHKFTRPIGRMFKARMNNPDLFKHPIVLGARHEIHRVPPPTSADLEMSNKRVVNGIVYTYVRIDRDYTGVVRTTEELNELETEHAVLSNFRTIRDGGNFNF